MKCKKCRGTGGHSARLGVINTDQVDDEWIEDYISGKFDEVCYECNGTGSVKKHHNYLNDPYVSPYKNQEY